MAAYFLCCTRVQYCALTWALIWIFVILILWIICKFINYVSLRVSLLIIPRHQWCLWQVCIPAFHESKCLCSPSSTKLILFSFGYCQLWRSINQLMGWGHAPVSAAVGALELHQFFDEKVASVRVSTVSSGCSVCTFRRMTADDVN